MSSVYFDPGLGGDGSTVSDDADPTTGLASGGHRSRFVPALGNMVSVSRAAVNAANAAAASLHTTAYAGTSTTALAVGPGSKTVVTQARKGWFVGQWLQLVAAGGAWLVGQVVSYNGTTLVLDASWFGGSGTVAHWTILPGAPWNVNSAQVVAKLAEMEAWKQTAMSSPVLDGLRLAQVSGLSEVLDGGSATRSWDASGGMKITEAVGGHYGQTVRVRLPAGKYQLTLSAVFLSGLINFTHANQDVNAPMFIGAEVVAANASVLSALVGVGGADYKGVGAGVAAGTPFSLSTTTDVCLAINTSGYNGRKQVMLTDLTLSRLTA